MTRPLKEVTEVANHVKEGDLSARATTSPKDEIGQLDQFINKMAETTSQAQAELKQKVEKRTKDLEEANQQLKTRNETLDKFAHTASHVLRSPLKVIKSLSEFILTDNKETLKPHSVEDLEQLIHRVKKMYRLTKDLLDYYSAGTERFLTQITDGSAMIQEIKDILHPREGLEIQINSSYF